jgi:hypothetical protein
MNTSGTSVVGIGVTLGVTPLMFSRGRIAVGTGVAVTLVTFGTVPVGASVPDVARVSAKTTPGSMRMMMHTVAMVRRTPEGVFRTVHIKKPFVCSINIVIIALKYECFPIHAGKRELVKSRMIAHFSGRFQILGVFERKMFVFETETKNQAIPHIFD